MTDPADGAFEDFDILFDRAIAPALAPFETQRQGVVRMFLLWLALIVTVAAAVAVWMVTVAGAAEPLFFVFFGMIGAAAIAHIPVGRFQTRCKSAALGELARSLDMTYEAEDFQPPAFERIKRLNLLPRYDNDHFEDLFAGHRSGVDFQLYECKLTERQDKTTVTKFQGQLLRMSFPKKFLGVTVVNRDEQRWFPPRGLQRVGLESSQFERIFEVFGSDQVEARFLVHPVFMERLMALEAAMAGRNLRCAFEEGDLLVAIEGENLFEIIDVYKPLPSRDNTRKGVEELQAVLGLIDAILAPPANVWAEAAKA